MNTVLIVFLCLFVAALLTAAILAILSLRAERDELLAEADQFRAMWEKETVRALDAEKRSDVASRLNGFFEDAPVQVPTWTQSDAEAFRHFLKTEAGQKFEQYLKALEQSRNRWAVQHFPHEPAMAGCARGFGQCLAHVVSLSADVRPEQDEPDAPLLQGADELREKFTP